MYNPEQQPPPGQQHMAPPRMSFSSDFALEPPPPASARPPGRAADADFEFSPVGSPMMAADQLFSKGRILPLRQAARAGAGAPTTLRDELRAREADRAARRGPRWKELLGLKRAAHGKKGAGPAAAASAADAHVDLGDNAGEAGE
ncbi:hypothetical protein BAE44_0025959 [Dichanthelium oligosanthes]|uniref:Uncharacterized protein n=1 Tax=Dichanthelium oligosanthes TaxID=888268 RepID=A0A1E5UJG3_9POAL|nr:hypothetical protein BAE44_0025959 [Dichanthelium oligosanthes]